MAPDRLTRLARLIDTLQATAPALRAAWLAALDAADADLVPHLQSWLRDSADATVTAETRPDTPHEPGDTLWRRAPELAFAALQRGISNSLEPAAGDAFGPWRLVAPLGRGGMGVVWRAARNDGAFQREVALKLPLVGPAPARLIERFARERDILAALTHPHIARLYDAGVSTSGQPYMALELVDGEAIHVWAQRHQLGPRQRVGLVLQVLQAVRHAHQQLVVHRDLKPSNILVSGDGSVHLLDFGIARLLDDGPPTPPGTPDATEFGTAAMTPTYAAPEQIERRPVGTAADIYSLGVVLYELLAGVSPYRPTHASRAALERAILDDEPEAPSLAATARPGGPRLWRRRPWDGDLDAIVLKALRKPPAERYASADAMAQDLQRWLVGLPVQAHAADASYRVRKFLRRHRAATTAAALAVLALVSGTAAALWQAGIAHRAAQRAEAAALEARHELQRAEAAQAFLIEMFDAADPARAQGRDPTVRELMARAEQLLPARLASQPELASHLRGALAGIYLKLSDEKRALPLAEARVAELRSRQGGVAPAELGAALLQLGLVHAEIGRHESALEAFAEAEKLLAAADGLRPPTPGVGPSEDLLLLRTKVAHSQLELRRWSQARASMATALPALEARLGPADPRVLDAQVSMISILLHLQEREAGMSLFAQVQPRLDRADPTQAMDVARMRHSLANALYIDGQWVPALQLQERALADLDRLVGPRNSVTIETLKLRAQFFDALGRVRESDAALQRVVELAYAFYGDADAQTALPESFRVMTLLKLGRAAEAEAAARRAAKIAEGRPGLREGARQGLQNRFALARVFNGQAGEGAALLEAVLKAQGDQPQWAPLAYLAGARMALGQPAAAEKAARAAVALAEPKTTPYSRVLLAKARLTLALALAAQAHPAEAQVEIERARLELTRVLPAESIEQSWPTLVQAQILREQHRDAEAAALDGAARQRWHAEGVPIPARLWLVY